MSDQARNLLRELPSVDRLVNHAHCKDLLRRFNRAYVVEICRQVLGDLRSEARHNPNDVVIPGDEEILARVSRRIAADAQTGLMRVVNATGTILHTNLGRAVLPRAAIEAVAAAAGQPVNVEYDLAAGKRGRRERAIERLLIGLTGAEAATVVNNNAAAVLLALNSLAQGKEVIVSRGELIEIGGSFRIPEIMAKSGAILKEVGSTNRTHPEDYEKAITERTALLLKVHTSNYKVIGFTTSVELEDLVAIAARHKLPVMEDLGSGALIDLGRFGLPKEPLVAERVASGADVVTFSGDKVLGGPQAGLIVGRKGLIERMNGNHLQRALRCGKLTLAALEATLRIYRHSPDPAQELPTLRAFTRPLAEIRTIGELIVPRLQSRLGAAFRVALQESTSQIGSGALPTEEIPSFAVAIEHRTAGPEHIARKFRAADPPVIGRVQDGRFLLDLRTIYDPSDLLPKFTG